MENKGHLEFIGIYGACARKQKEFNERGKHDVESIVDFAADIKETELNGIINYHSQIQEFIGHDIKLKEMPYIYAAMQLLASNYLSNAEKLGQKEMCDMLIKDCEKFITTVSVVKKTSGGEK